MSRSYEALRQLAAQIYERKLHHARVVYDRQLKAIDTVQAISRAPKTPAPGHLVSGNEDAQ